jgi:hypothetical protein
LGANVRFGSKADLGLKKSDRLNAVAEILPEFFGCGRPGESTRQSNDRNIDILPWSFHAGTSAITGTWTLIIVL